MGTFWQQVNFGFKADLSCILTFSTIAQNCSAASVRGQHEEAYANVSALQSIRIGGDANHFSLLLQRKCFMEAQLKRE